MVWSKNYDKEKLIEGVAKSKSFVQVLVYLGLTPKGGNYSVLKRHIEKFSLDTSHFTGQGSNIGRKFGVKRPLQYYFDNKTTIGSNDLKRRLLLEGILERKCAKCGLSKWLDGLIPLELEHKNGNHYDNTLDNLELLCPNCHAQTSTYRGKNIRASDATGKTCQT